MYMFIAKLFTLQLYNHWHTRALPAARAFTAVLAHRCASSHARCSSPGRALCSSSRAARRAQELIAARLAGPETEHEPSPLDSRCLPGSSSCSVARQPVCSKRCSRGRRASTDTSAANAASDSVCGVLCVMCRQRPSRMWVREVRAAKASSERAAMSALTARDSRTGVEGGRGREGREEPGVGRRGHRSTLNSKSSACQSEEGCLSVELSHLD